MQSFVVFMLFVGVFIVVHCVYEEKFRALQNDVRVEHRFVPRTYYEEQHATPDLAGKLKGLFEPSSPWMQRRKADEVAVGGGKGGGGEEEEDEEEEDEDDD